MSSRRLLAPSEHTYLPPIVPGSIYLPMRDLPRINYRTRYPVPASASFKSPGMRNLSSRKGSRHLGRWWKTFLANQPFLDAQYPTLHYRRVGPPHWAVYVRDAGKLLGSHSINAKAVAFSFTEEKRRYGDGTALSSALSEYGWGNERFGTRTRTLRSSTMEKREHTKEAGEKEMLYACLACSLTRLFPMAL